MKRRNDNESLEILAQQWGMDPWSLVQACALRPVVPAICTNLDCEEYSTEAMPDCATGFCNYCGEDSMVSCLALSGVI